ncbi:hypothetical protein V8C34DRAFT_288588 [Trichoderma compactum]
MPANAKWPDFQLASKLRYFMGSSAPESTQSETTSSQLDQAKREQLESAREGDQDLGGETHTATMAEIDNAPIEEMEDVENNPDEGETADVDVDFGDLEMFDSNASQLPFSSQAPQSLKYEEPQFPTSSGSAKRDKSSKKKSRVSDVAADDKHLNAATSKRKKSKKKSLQHSEIAEDQPTDTNLNTTSAPTAAKDDERGPDALEDATTEMDALDLVQAQSAQKKKKKRKPSDSVDGKRNKKRKGIEDAHPIVEQTPDETENLDARDTAASPQLGTAIEDDVANADEQLSPSAARARRRSRTGEETRSRENSVPFRAQVAPMAPMAIDSPPQEEASNDQREISGDHVDDDEEMLNIAREVWREHKSSQHEASNGANEANLDQNAIGVNGSGDSAQVEEQPTESPVRRRSTRTKVKPVLLVQTMETKTETPSKKNRQALGELPSPSANTPKPRARAKRATKKQTQRPLQPLEGDAENAAYEEPLARTGGSGNYTQGRLTEAESDGISRAIEQFRDEYGMTQAEVNQMIQAPGGTTAGDAHARLWYRLFEVCPDRKRQKVINVARKKYHNFVARGTWTPEQDEELSQLIVVHGNKWSEIAGLINRHPEDVRDRYRNYIVCGPYQRKDVWSEEEEQLLAQVVEEAMEAIEEIRKDPKNPYHTKNIEDILDWQDISKNMERKRSRLQCLTKWKAMQNRLSGKKKDKKSASEKKPASRKKKRPEPAEIPVSNEDISSQLDLARQQLASMHEEEQYRLVLAIQQASVLLDADIPWAKLLDKKFRGQWSLHTQVLLWDRLKQTVPGWEALTVLDVAQHIINEYNRTGGLPEINGSGYDDDEREKEILQQLHFRSRPAPPPKSAEFVEDSGAEETGAAEDNMADITIDPALMEAPPPSPPKATPKPKKKTYGRKKAKKAILDIRDPIEDGQPAIPLAAADEGEESNLEEAQTPQIIIPRNFMATKSRKEENGVAALPAEPYSDSDMDDMEDLPAKILA